MEAANSVYVQNISVVIAVVKKQTGTSDLAQQREATIFLCILQLLRIQNEQRPSVTS